MEFGLFMHSKNGVFSVTKTLMKNESSLDHQQIACAEKPISSERRSKKIMNDLF